MHKQTAVLRGVASQYRAILLISAAALLWAAIEVIGALLPDSPSPYQVVWVRYAVHLSFLVVVFGPHYRSRLWRTTHIWRQLGRGLLMLGMPICFILSVQHFSVTGTWAVFWLTPLLVLGLAAILLHQRSGWLVWVATAAAYAGALILLRPHHELLSPALILPIGMALCFTLYLVASRLLRSEAILPSLFYTALAVFVPLSVRLPAFWRPLSWAGGLGMASIGLLGLLLIFCLDKALELAPLTVIAPFLLATPLWEAGLDGLLGSGVWSRLFLSGLVVVGALCVLLVYYRRTNAFAPAAVLAIVPVAGKSQEQFPENDVPLRSM